MDATHSLWFGTTAGPGTAQASVTASILNPGTAFILTAGPDISAGTQDMATGTVVFSNANGLVFGMSNGTITASYTTPSTAGLLSAIKLSAGAQSSNLSAVTFSNSNGVSFGLSNGTITASVVAGAGGSLHVSAGTTQNTLSDLVFSNSNGVSFGLNGSTITGTVKTDYQTSGNYLTTAMASNAATISNINLSAGTTSGNGSAFTFDDRNGISFGFDNGTITGTVRTNYQSSGAYLTTAALSQDSSKYAGTIGGMTGGSITMDTAGVQISLPAYLTTAAPVGAYLTTARASNDAIGLNTAITQNGVSMTANSSGLSLDFPAFLTTAQAPGAYLTTARASNDAIGLNTAQTNVTWTVNSSGISLNASGYAGTGFTTTITTGGVMLGTLNKAGFSLLVPNYLTTAQPVGAYLTTAALSGDSSKYAGINGAITGGSITVDTSGVSINLPAYLTTAMQSASSSVFAKTGFTTTTTTGTVIVGTHDTNGLSMGVPAFITTAMASNAATISNINVSASNTSANLSNLVFSNSNSISFGLSGSTITAQVANPLANQFIWEPSGQTSTGQISVSNASIFYVPVPFDITFTRVDLHCLVSLASAAVTNTAAVFITSGLVIYSVSGSSTLNPIAGKLGSTTFSWASNTSNFGSLTGGRILSFPIATTLAAGIYYIGAQISTTTGSFVGAANTTALGASMSMIYGLSNTASSFADLGSNTATTVGFIPMRGIYTNTFSASNQTLAMANISIVGNPGARANIAINFRNQ